MANYENTEIYKIICLDIDVKEFYIGHTTNIKQRDNTHKQNCNPNHSKSDMNLYKFIREHGGYDNRHMEIIESYKCENLNQACEREQYWIEQMNPELNDRKANLTAEEKRLYRNEWKRNSVRHHEYNIEYAKKHTPEQKAHILLKQRERYALQTPEQKAKYNQSRKDKREKSNIAMMDALVAIN